MGGAFPQAFQLIVKTVKGVIEDRKANPKPDKDLLNMMMQAKDSQSGKGLEEPEVIGNSLVMLMAGYETTSNALSYAVFLLAQNPDVESRMVAEIKSTRAGNPEPPTKEELPEYNYVLWVCNETLRMLPPVPTYPREASKDLNICGYDVPAGTAVFVSAYAIHHDEKHYADPLVFRPERWDPNGKEQQERHPNAFLPFGYGARKCIGYRFALQEMQLTLIRLYSEFTFKLDPSMPLPLQLEPGITMTPWGGISVLPERRNLD